LFNGERIIGDTRRRTVPLPIFLMTYQDWAYWRIAGGGVWLVQTADRALKLGVGVKLRPGYQADDDPELVGMEKRKTSLDGYVNALWKTPAANVGVRYYHDMANVSDGTAVTLRFSRNFQIDPAFRLTPSISVEWLNAKYVDYYYGVRSAEALPSRPAYAGRDALNIGAGVAGAIRISPSWSLLGGVYGTRLGRGITNSPIVTQDYSTLVYFGAGWIF
jgi:outer membrane protein